MFLLTNKCGRKISRFINEEVREKLKSQYKQSESQSIYKLRQQQVEFPFGHMKRNLKVSAFFMRGNEEIKAEMPLLATCFNMARIITFLRVPVLIEKLTC